MLNIDNREDIQQRTGGQLVILVYNNRTEEFPLHWHNYVEIVQATSTPLTIEVSGTPYHLAKDSILFIWPGEVHRILPMDKPATTFLQFDPNIMMQFPSISRRYRMSHRIRQINAAEQPELYQYIHSIILDINKAQIANKTTPEPYYEFNQYQKVCNLMIALQNYELFAHELSSAPELATAGSGMQRIQKACSYIAQHFDTDLSMTDVAEYVEMSKYYFSRSFEKYTGTSFSSYLSSYRINKAKELLSDPSNKITDIAMQAGFGSLASFNRVFRTMENMSPTDFRKLHQDQ